jgi:hypothetical protein
MKREVDTEQQMRQADTRSKKEYEKTRAYSGEKEIGARNEGSSMTRLARRFDDYSRAALAHRAVAAIRHAEVRGDHLLASRS